MTINDRESQATAAGRWCHLSRSHVLPSPRLIIASECIHPVYSPPPSPRLSTTTSGVFRSCVFTSVASRLLRTELEDYLARIMAYNFPGVPATAMPPMGERQPIPLIVTPCTFLQIDPESVTATSFFKSMCNSQVWDQ